MSDSREAVFEVVVSGHGSNSGCIRSANRNCDGLLSLQNTRCIKSAKYGDGEPSFAPVSGNLRVCTFQSSIGFCLKDLIAT